MDDPVRLSSPAALLRRSCSRATPCASTGRNPATGAPGAPTLYWHRLGRKSVQEFASVPSTPPPGHRPGSLEIVQADLSQMNAPWGLGRDSRG
jgi:hypothetical protein